MAYVLKYDSPRPVYLSKGGMLTVDPKDTLQFKSKEKADKAARRMGELFTGSFKVVEA